MEGAPARRHAGKAVDSWCHAQPSCSSNAVRGEAPLAQCSEIDWNLFVSS